MRSYDVPQLVAPGDVARHAVLPSFLYVTDAAQRESGAVRLPWDPAPDLVAGMFAREEGALVPARQISSAKSWLSNALVDRTAALLPWGAEQGHQISPVAASARLLRHLRDAWNHDHAQHDEERRLEKQTIVLAVPASFDEEARELTVEAARDAGFADLTLLEEPLAALYAWLAGHRRELPAAFGDGALILVCDVGGGTTDFSLIRAHTAGAELAFERIAIGEHLLLGGDNLDLALAVMAEQKLGEGASLSLGQRLTLRRKCSAAKEQLLAERGPASAAITILGAGRGVVGGRRTVALTREEVTRTLTEGFLPITAADDLPARDRRAGLRELGLPYETEPAITRHLAAFLRRAAGRDGGGMARPDAVLFNGGFFATALARRQVLDALASWLGGAPPRELENDRPESAVAVGAAFYGRLRRDPSAARRLLIKAGSARAYYIGAGAESAICVLPRGTGEGTRFDIDRELLVETNRPAAFNLYSSIDRADPLNELIDVKETGLERHAPLVTALRFGKRSRHVPLAVRLTAAFTETGTLELWCESRSTDHRWRLAFHLRAVERERLDEADDDERSREPDPGAEVIVADEALDRSAAMVRQVFGGGAPALAADALPAEIENALGHGKHAWPLSAIRRLADALLEAEAGRRLSASHEARWLNLTGFCMRPGFGSPLDDWRVSELRKVYAAGLAFPKEVQNQVEAIVLWQRVAAGFSAGQQRELAQRITGQLGLGQRKTSRVNPQVEREGLRLLASLERLDAATRARFGEQLIDRIRREPRNASWLWAIGRVGARTPLYGPLNGVVPTTAAESWIERLLSLKTMTPDVAGAVAQIGARTGDPARDIDDRCRDTAAERLAHAGFADAATRLRTVTAPDRADAGRIFGETLPEGLQLVTPGT